MKKKFLGFCLLVFTLSFLLSVPALATDTRASDQIRDYYIDAYACGGGQIEIDFYVKGNSQMQRLGAFDIAIYEKSGSSWSVKRTYSEFSDGMAVNNASEYSNSIFYDGTVGATYKVEVTIFARNSAGTDTRSQTFTSIVVR